METIISTNYILYIFFEEYIFKIKFQTLNQLFLYLTIKGTPFNSTVNFTKKNKLNLHITFTYTFRIIILIIK